MNIPALGKAFNQISDLLFEAFKFDGSKVHIDLDMESVAFFDDTHDMQSVYIPLEMVDKFCEGDKEPLENFVNAVKERYDNEKRRKEERDRENEKRAEQHVLKLLIEKYGLPNYDQTQKTNDENN